MSNKIKDAESKVSQLEQQLGRASANHVQEQSQLEASLKSQHHEAISRLEDQLNDQKLELKEFGRAKARVKELEEAHTLVNASKSDEV